MFLNVAGFPVMVVGGGQVGLRKTRSMLECGAVVTVVSPAFDPQYEPLTMIERLKEPYAANHLALKRWRLVFAATNSDEVNEKVQADAGAHGVLCCRADEPAEGDFAGGATQRLGADPAVPGAILAVSTLGSSPVLGMRICRQAAAGVDPVLPAMARLLMRWRAVVKREIADIQVRRKLMRRLAGVEMEAILRSEGEAGAESSFGHWIAVAKNAH